MNAEAIALIVVLLVSVVVAYTFFIKPKPKKQEPENPTVPEETPPKKPSNSKLGGIIFLDCPDVIKCTEVPDIYTTGTGAVNPYSKKRVIEIDYTKLIDLETWHHLNYFWTDIFMNMYNKYGHISTTDYEAAQRGYQTLVKPMLQKAYDDIRDRATKIVSQKYDNTIIFKIVGKFNYGALRESVFKLPKLPPGPPPLPQILYRNRGTSSETSIIPPGPENYFKPPM